MHIEHAAGHFDFRVQDVILFVYQEYDATVLIIRGCRCVNEVMVMRYSLIKSGKSSSSLWLVSKKAATEKFASGNSLSKKPFYWAVDRAAARRPPLFHIATCKPAILSWVILKKGEKDTYSGQKPSGKWETDNSESGVVAHATRCARAPQSARALPHGDNRKVNASRVGNIAGRAQLIKI